MSSTDNEVQRKNPLSIDYTRVFQGMLGQEG